MSVMIALGALDDEILGKVAELSGENVYRCMQCGTCSAVCPMIESMAPTVRQVMLLLQHGLGEEVAGSKSAWVCASCHTCEVRCPRGIDIPRVMEAVRLLQLRQGEDYVDPRAIPAEKLEELPQIALVSSFRKFTS